jgi:hypothetical protein
VAEAWRQKLRPHPKQARQAGNGGKGGRRNPNSGPAKELLPGWDV